MQMTTDARAWLHATVRRILARHPLGDAERAGITYELMSHLHAAAETRAAAAGRTEVVREDLEAVIADAGGEAGLMRAFVQPLATPVERAGLGPRLGALAIDALLLGIALAFVHGVLASALEPLLGRAASPTFPFSPLWLFPWAFHDPGLHVAAQAIIALASGALILGYFTWLEAREGRTLGKRAMGLRVARVDGQPVTYRESIIRNLVKLSPPLLVLEALVLLLARGDDLRRVSDRLADTVVVKG